MFSANANCFVLRAQAAESVASEERELAAAGWPCGLPLEYTIVPASTSAMAHTFNGVAHCELWNRQ